MALVERTVYLPIEYSVLPLTALSVCGIHRLLNILCSAPRQCVWGGPPGPRTTPPSSSALSVLARAGPGVRRGRRRPPHSEICSELQRHHTSLARPRFPPSRPSVQQWHSASALERTFVDTKRRFPRKTALYPGRIAPAGERPSRWLPLLSPRRDLSG